MYSSENPVDPVFSQDSKLVEAFSQRFINYLRGDFAQGKISSAIKGDDPGMLTRLFDGMQFSEELGLAILADTRKAQDNLPNYLNSVARGCADLLFNNDLSDLHPEVISAIGEDNYNQLKIAVGGEQEMVKKVLQSSIALHTQVITDAFYKDQIIDINDDSKTPMTEEQIESLQGFTAQFTKPSQTFIEALTPATLSLDYSENKKEIDSEQYKQALDNLTQLRDNLIEAQTQFQNSINALEKWGVLKGKSDNKQEVSLNTADTIKQLKELKTILSRKEDSLTNTIENPPAQLTADGLNHILNEHIKSIQDLKTSPDIQLNNPREKTRAENILDAIIRFVTRNKYHYEPKEVAEARKITAKAQETTNAAKEALNNLRISSSETEKTSTDVIEQDEGNHPAM